MKEYFDATLIIEAFNSLQKLATAHGYPICLNTTTKAPLTLYYNEEYPDRILVDKTLSKPVVDDFVFNWSMLTRKDFVYWCFLVENYEMDDGYCIGSVFVGSLCFDLVSRRCDQGKWHLDYDLYVGGVDDGYGYLSNGNAYSHDGGGSFDELMICMPYEEFQQYVEGVFTEFINNEGSTLGVSLKEKAKQPFDWLVH